MNSFEASSDTPKVRPAELGNDQPPSTDSVNAGEYTLHSVEPDVLVAAVNGVHRTIYSSLYDAGLHYYDAQDVLSHAILTTWQKFGPQSGRELQVHDGRTLKYCVESYLFTTAHLTGRNVWRRRKREAVLTIGESELDNKPAPRYDSPDVVSCGRDQLRIVQRAIDDLPPRQRMVVEGLLRGLSHEEMAIEIGMTKAAVKSCISRARQTLKAACGDQNQSDSEPDT